MLTSLSTGCLNRLRGATWKRWPHVAAILTLVLLGCSGLAQRYPREPGEGNVWLKWDKERKEDFVYAYLIGHSDGTKNGCFVADDVLFSRFEGLSKELDLVRECIKGRKHFSESATFYSDIVTAFYKKYPDQRN